MVGVPFVGKAVGVVLDHTATVGFIEVIVTINFVMVGHAGRRGIARMTTVIFVRRRSLDKSIMDC